MSEPRVSGYNVLTGKWTTRAEPAGADMTFDDPMCDAPGFLDPLHPDEPSVRCELKAGHDGQHRGYLSVHWEAS